MRRNADRLNYNRTLSPVLALSVTLAGCSLAPPGTLEEQAKAERFSTLFEAPPDLDRLARVPPRADWRSVLHRAFLANGELRSAYFEWKAALARIDQAATWPNSNVALSFSYMFSPEQMKAWDRTTIGLGFDPSMNLSLPIKVQTAGLVALDAARQAGEKFRAVKFDIQRKALSMYLDLALTEEKIRIGRQNLALLKLVSESASSRAQAGGPLQDLLKAQIETQMAENELASMEAEAKSMRGQLNGMLARDARAPLSLPPSLPLPRPIAANDAQLIAAAVDQNPELAALARQVEGRRDALELAKLAYFPDIIPSASVTGTLSQAIGAMVMLPTRLPAIRGAIDEADAMAKSSEAMLQQTRSDRAASFVANLYILRNADRQAALYRQRIVPAAEQLVNSSRSEYAAGSIGFAELIDSLRTLITTRRAVAQIRIEREKRLAEIEALAGRDIETIGRIAKTGCDGGRSSCP
ncbi:TolC family protein [Bradyrhizobium yuanmingense]|uniref:TolC family protein n=1 Tax=Bradyrhizobium yuanmingense TaxID=108015 RepID=UPI001CD19823|nr:TolC family protein [Bradyrhizobium yuanmingense]MCA1529056.1 TolC family protein [Bradyrhizobium yuanmingense]